MEKIKKSNERASLLNNRSSKIFVFAALAFLTILGLIFQQPYLAFVATSFALFVSLRRILSNVAAACSSVIVPFTAIGLVEVWTPHFPLKFTWVIGFFFVLLISLSGFFFLKQHSTLPNKFSIQRMWQGLAVITPSLLTIGLLFSRGNLVGNNLTWMLYGDAQTNTSSLLEIISLNGFAGGLPAISQGLMAASVAGILGVDVSTSQFVPLMQIQATDLALMWAALSILFGLVASQELRSNSYIVRLFGSFLGAALPLSSFLLGFSIDAGFYNTPFALLAIVSAWIFWREAQSLSGIVFWISQILLVVTSLYALLAWAPLAVFPVFLLLFVFANIFIKSGAFQLKFVLIGATVFVFAVLFFWVVVLPRVSGLSSIASAEGWMTNVPFQLVLGSLFIGLITAILIGFTFRKTGDSALGLAIVIMSTITGVGFLFVQALDLNEPLAWRYYPRKMAWMTIFFVIFITPIVFTGSQLFLSMQQWWKKSLTIVSVLGLVGAAFISIPYGSKEPLRIFPLLNIAINGQDVDQTIPVIASSLGQKHIRLGYDGNDFITNQWVFQWEKYKNESPIWSYAYSSIQSPDDVCSAAGTWGGGVTLFTRDEAAMVETLEKCGPLISEVISQ